jgi:hypothetical protein
MAVQGSGTVKQTIDPPMQDRTNSNCARDGAAKKPQTNFPVHPGMKSRIAYRGAGPENPGTGPDAGSPNVMDPSPKLKKFGPVGTKWGMTDPNGQSVNNELGQKVLAEGKLTGRG